MWKASANEKRDDISKNNFKKTIYASHFTLLFINEIIINFRGKKRERFKCPTTI